MEKTINLEDLYRELKKIEQIMVTRKELKRIMETILVGSNEETMKQIELSREDITVGRVRKIKSVEEI